LRRSPFLFARNLRISFSDPRSTLSKEPLPAPLLNNRLRLCDQLGMRGETFLRSQGDLAHRNLGGLATTLCLELALDRCSGFAVCKSYRGVMQLCLKFC
jgi:hypothetical protein